MTLDRRITAFSKLGERLRSSLDEQSSGSDSSVEFENLIQKTTILNPWFTPSNVRLALDRWSQTLTAQNLLNWMSSYETKEIESKTVALVMAGNIPMVGFHDLLSVLMVGHKALVKLSSQDAVLMPYLVQQLTQIDPYFEDRVVFTKEKLQGFDMVIATGSNNTARYFDYYFSKYPNILRKNRNSVAVLTGQESVDDLKALANDVFQYFGLGCRNVTKLMVPESYDFQDFFGGMYHFSDIINHHKYANNYDYHKAVELLNGTDLLDNGFLLLKNSSHYASPIGMLHWESYSDRILLQSKFSQDQEFIQCVVGQDYVPFGNAQRPSLSDFADGIDTVEFLLKN
ncbi:MAG: acyl-CoA reductase [Bacteroidetes bacterium]|nr:acyl-CoA reductase [Bacteroidota bacterium]MDA0879134.1 acyl-CoA reductase [Bacteroidota bacterium]MDA1115598.1 acyl-CoA reductase [Bacteroidota bacterium]